MSLRDYGNDFRTLISDYGGIAIPPLVTARGVPIDGRHRTLAAMALGLNQAPVMDIDDVW